MPFTHEQFLDLFGLYNAQLWPAVVGLWIASIAAVVQYFRGRLTMRSAIGLLVVHWAWSGVVYHAAFFTRINPAAWLFAALFVLEAGLLARYAMARRPMPATDTTLMRSRVAEAFLVSALAYPGLVLVTGLDLPRAPLFAVPCPTTLLTAGLLLAMAPSVPRSLSVVPVLWAMVGGVAAVTFRVIPDVLLLAAAVALTLSGLRQRHSPAARAHLHARP